MRLRNVQILLIVCLLFSRIVFSTTWWDSDEKCPICGTVNKFKAVGSYGSYIYQEESRFQYVFFPYTSKLCVYTCKKCRFSVFGGDFESLPSEKKEAVQQVLNKLELPEPLLKPKEQEYSDLPNWARLVVAEEIYKILNKDKEFWCHFYRVLGYHAEQESKTELAANSRQRSLQFALELLDTQPGAESGLQKEWLIVTGAMSLFSRR